MAAVRADLAQTVGTSTAGKDRAEVVQHIAARLKAPLRIDAESQQTLRASKLAQELSGLSCGTALAYTVRCEGLAMAPAISGGSLSYLIVPAKPGQDVWPVGWKPDKPAKDVLPILYEFLNVNIQGVPAAKAIEAIGGRIKVPLLIDDNALARYGIDPDKVTVKLPQGRSTYSLTLQKLLFQARLKFEVRVDEAQSPLVWITSVKPL
jgi:hypothetical protein